MSPVFFQKIKFLDKPIDNKIKWKGKRLLGDNKTWRGLFFGTLLGALFFEFQRILYNSNIFRGLAFIDYSSAPFYLGFLLGFSALFGDAVFSFFKRRLNILPGHSWIPFDQIDFLIFSLVLTALWSGISVKESLIVLTIVFFGTVLVQTTGYFLKLKKDFL